VRRIVIRDGRALGVEWERRGRRGAAGSRGDVVLAAGAFGTPHLLQLSGVGDPQHLRSIGVECLAESPAVGAHLTEHPLTLVNWELQPGNLGLSDATHPRYLLRWLASGAASRRATSPRRSRTSDRCRSCRAPTSSCCSGPRSSGATARTSTRLPRW
jgi:choline dehydrogenase-like flavoprotein